MNNLVKFILSGLLIALLFSCAKDTTVTDDIMEDTLELRSSDCYEDETAWAQGSRYTERGNWAMYVTYDNQDKTVPLIAGQHWVAGYVTFTRLINGDVEIYIRIMGNWRFAQFDTPDDNVKIQGYDEAPSGNPSPGHFEYRAFRDINESSCRMVVPYSKYYGVHADLWRGVVYDDNSSSNTSKKGKKRRR